jgi:hypothetical protein
MKNTLPFLATALIALMGWSAPAEARWHNHGHHYGYSHGSGHSSHKPHVRKHKKSRSSGEIAGSGASARCRDGTLSYSRHRRGTCSHHKGVAAWL